MKPLTLKVFPLLWLIVFLILAAMAPLTALNARQDLGAQNVGDIINRLDKTAQEAKIIEQPATAPTVYQYIGRFVNLFLAFLGVVFLLIVIYSGFNWMMAKGNQQMVDEAIKSIESASVGLIIIILSYIFINFLVFKVIDFTTK